jgi:signal transduction histidine kinase/ActR/RegA family two-component response regulator
MTAALTVNRTAAIGESCPDRAASALDYLHRLLLDAESSAACLDDHLADLATSFGARGAGLLIVLHGTPQVLGHCGSDRQPRFPRRYPWQEKPELLDEVRVTKSSLSVRAEGAWLIADCQSAAAALMVWLEDTDRRSWSPSESAALALAGQTIARFGQHQPWLKLLRRARVQSALEQGAAITGRLAHDFGNMLTGIMGFAELAMAQLPGESLPRRYVAEVVQAGKNGSEWIQRLQLFSRKNATEYWPASLAQVVKEEEARIRSVSAGKVTLQVDLEPDLPAIAMDKEALRHVLGQLLDNAREASADDSVVSLIASQRQIVDDDCQEILGNIAPGRFVEVIIADAGCGVQAAASARLFTELFYSNKPRHRGLGLAMVYGILRTSHGGLRLGPHPAQGTTVHVFLPVTKTAGRTLVPGPTMRPRVLIVADDPDALHFLSRIVERAGCHAETATKALDAVERQLTAGERLELVVADVRLIRSCGFDLLSKLRETQPRLPIILLGNDQEEIASSLPCVTWLSRPWRPQTLIHAISSALDAGRKSSSTRAAGTAKSS